MHIRTVIIVYNNRVECKTNRTRIHHTHTILVASASPAAATEINGLHRGGKDGSADRRPTRKPISSTPTTARLARPVDVGLRYKDTLTQLKQETICDVKKHRISK